MWTTRTKGSLRNTNLSACQHSTTPYRHLQAGLHAPSEGHGRDEDSPKPRIANVAIETGVQALDAAQKPPNAEMIGLDISDQLFPSTWTTSLTNCSFRLYDLLQEVPAELQAQCDLVHVRVLLVYEPLDNKALFLDRF